MEEDLEICAIWNWNLASSDISSQKQRRTVHKLPWNSGTKTENGDIGKYYPTILQIARTNLIE